MSDRCEAWGRAIGHHSAQCRLRLNHEMPHDFTPLDPSEPPSLGDPEPDTVRTVYVATSWRNELQPGVVVNLRRWGYDVYDFRNPSDGDNGFHWSEIDPKWQEWTPETYRDHLTHPLAEIGFAKDMDALRVADAVVLVNPCGRSAHLELAWALGAGKPGIILLSDGEPELMYKMATSVCVSLDEVRAALRAAQLSPGEPTMGDAPREAVTRFTAQMEAKLRQYDSTRKDSWLAMSPQGLFERLDLEVGELTWAMDRESKMAECIDVANYAMFLWNRLTVDTGERKDGGA